VDVRFACREEGVNDEPLIFEAKGAVLEHALFRWYPETISVLKVQKSVENQRCPRLTGFGSWFVDRLHNGVNRSMRKPPEPCSWYARFDGQSSSRSASNLSCRRKHMC
jgi:hypothetical protein